VVNLRLSQNEMARRNLLSCFPKVYNKHQLYYYAFNFAQRIRNVIKSCKKPFRKFVRIIEKILTIVNSQFR
jgi:hypothetical protein